MKFSRLRRRITIEGSTTSPGTMGERSDTWTTAARPWAERNDKRAGTQEAAGQRYPEATTIFTTRHNSKTAAVTVEHRIRHGTETFDIVGIINVPGDRPEKIEFHTKIKQ